VHQPAECRVRDVAKGIAANAAPDIAASVTADSTAGGTVHVIRSFLNWAPHVQRKRQTGNVTGKDRQKRDRGIDVDVPPARGTVRRFAQVPNQVVPPDFDAPYQNPKSTPGKATRTRLHSRGRASTLAPSGVAFVRIRE
jgi:hypothetical protein